MTFCHPLSLLGKKLPYHTFIGAFSLMHSHICYLYYNHSFRYVYSIQNKCVWCGCNCEVCRRGMTETRYSTKYCIMFCSLPQHVCFTNVFNCFCIYLSCTLLLSITAIIFIYSIYSLWCLVPSRNVFQTEWPWQKCLYLSLFKHTFLTCSLPLPSTTLSGVYSVTLSFHLTTGLPFLLWPSVSFTCTLFTNSSLFFLSIWPIRFNKV